MGWCNVLATSYIYKILPSLFSLWYSVWNQKLHDCIYFQKGFFGGIKILMLFWMLSIISVFLNKDHIPNV